MASRMRPSYTVWFLLFVGHLCHLHASSNVPLVQWSSEERSIESNSNIFAGHTLSGKEVHQSYFKDSATRKSKKVLIVFIQDQLSMDDFTKYSNSFKYLRHIFDKFHPVSLPSVSIQTPTVLDLLQDDFKGKVHEVYSSDISEWKYPADAHTKEMLLMFHLNPVAQSFGDGRASILKSNDAIMHKIMSQIQEKTNKYSVVFTGEKPNEAIEKLHAAELFDELSSLSQRHLLATGDTPSTTLNKNTSDIMIYASKVVLSTVNGPMIGANFDIKGSGNASLQVHSTGENSTFDFRIDFQSGGDGWSCSNVTLEALGTSLTFPCGGSSLENTITAPDSMAYGCRATTFGNATINITFVGVKIQYGSGGKWGEIYECATLFTVPILSGLFITLLLAVSVLFGLSSMAAIQTPDRFDDPKGPMISVPQTE